jgi:hypothetical protein
MADVLRIYWDTEGYAHTACLHWEGFPKILWDTLSVFNRLPTEGYTQGGKFWVRERRDQELEGAKNTRL